MRYPIAFVLATTTLAAAGTRIDAELFHAIRNDDVAAVRKLLNDGAEVNARDTQGATPVMRAALYCSVPCLRILLDRGADPNRFNTAGATALMWAAGDAEKVRLLLAYKAAVNARAKSGRTPLIIASAVHGNRDAVKMLLRAGADVKARDNAGTGPVWAAAMAGDAGVLTELLEHGGDPNEQHTRLGTTALMNAAAHGSREAVRVLLEAGADVDRRSRPPVAVKAGLQDRGEMNALLMAAPIADRNTIELLLKAHANPDVPEYRGMNSLISAVTSERQDVSIVRLLLRNTADVNVKDKNGLTAMDWARKWGDDTAIVRTLRDAGAAGSSEPAVAAPGNVPGKVTTRQAVEKSVALIQASNRQFFRASGCAACHHQMLGGMLVALAREKNVPVNEGLAAEQIKEMLAERAPGRESLYQRQRLGGFPMRDSLLLVSLAAQKYPADDFTDAVVHNLMGAQWGDGSWRRGDNRPPMQYSAISDTAYAIRAIQSYAPPGWRAEVQRRVRLAATWLARVKPIHTEEKALQLQGLAWASADPRKIRELGRRLLAEQLPDRGWAQRSGFASDAYATGQALYALASAGGIPVSNGAWQRGARYLLETQYPDGSWYARSRSVKFQPYFESGFPYGHNQWISAAATAWAAMALALWAE